MGGGGGLTEPTAGSHAASNPCTNVRPAVSDCTDIAPSVDRHSRITPSARARSLVRRQHNDVTFVCQHAQRASPQHNASPAGVPGVREHAQHLRRQQFCCHFDVGSADVGHEEG